MLSRDEYDRALARIDYLMELDPEVGTPEGAELTDLVDVVLEYELHHFPMLGFQSYDARGKPKPI